MSTNRVSFTINILTLPHRPLSVLGNVYKFIGIRGERRGEQGSIRTFIGGRPYHFFTIGVFAYD